MSGQGQTAIPHSLVETDEELRQIAYVYGRDAARAGFRFNNNPPPVVARILQKKHCSTLQGKEYNDHCGPFRADYYTNPIYVEGRGEPVDDLPPR